MTPEERYLFDLRGYLVVRQAIPPDLLRRLNEAVDDLEALSDAAMEERSLPRKYARSDLYAKVGERVDGGLGDYSLDILAYGDPFEEIIDCPSTLPYLESMVGDDCRLDAANFMSRGSRGAFLFHHGYAELLPYREYAFENGEFRCMSVKISYALTDVGVHDGCFAVIPGSHKSNFSNPLVGGVPDPKHPLVEPIPCQAGDAVLFSEDLSHGAVENLRSTVRRTLFYSYAPPFHCDWGSVSKLAPGFDERAGHRRKSLVKGADPYGADAEEVDG